MKRTEKTYTLAEARKMLEKKNPKSVIQATKEVEESQLVIDEVIFQNPNEKGQWQTQIKYAPFEDGIGGIIKIYQHSFYQGQHKLNFVKFSTSKFFGSTKGFTDKLVKGKNWKAYTKQAKQ